MPKKTLHIPDASGRLGSIDAAEWRRRDLETRHGALFEALHENPTESELDVAQPRAGRVYGAMAGGGGHGG